MNGQMNRLFLRQEVQKANTWRYVQHPYS
jgi:hypothetical protein